MIFFFIILDTGFTLFYKFDIVFVFFLKRFIKSTPDKKVFFSVNIAVILTTGKPVRLSQTLNKLESCINLSKPNPE